VLRRIILSVDAALDKNIKWNGPNFTHQGEDRITMRRFLWHHANIVATAPLLCRVCRPHSCAAFSTFVYQLDKIKLLNLKENFMTTLSLSLTAPSKSQRITGWIMSGFVILFLLFDAIIKFVQPDVVVQTTVNELGFKLHHIGTIGVTGLIAVVLYAIPRTAILGAILITAQLGGAIASHVRVDNPLFSHTLFPVYIGILVWGGLWMRIPALRKLLPLVKPE